MVFLSWARPSLKEQKDCINKSGTFNYDGKYRGATTKPLSILKEDEDLSRDGFVINHSKIMVGSGSDAYEKGKTALKTWKLFMLMKLNAIQRMLRLLVLVEALSEDTYWFVLPLVC
ncbi:hypothetical protein E3N88_12251 [Mikania micrantha]|uniref:Uncharacterized protein n=1 Tax=Mikania micrantha TaxID=192012 RepID=A0A5N6P5A7_9ASTR|nr:hypothetical protein E3N88_12251 [Mikania micrantha]